MASTIFSGVFNAVEYKVLLRDHKDLLEEKKSLRHAANKLSKKLDEVTKENEFLRKNINLEMLMKEDNNLRCREIKLFEMKDKFKEEVKELEKLKREVMCEKLKLDEDSIRFKRDKKRFLNDRRKYNQVKRQKLNDDTFMLSEYFLVERDDDKLLSKLKEKVDAEDLQIEMFLDRVTDFFIRGFSEEELVMFLVDIYLAYEKNLTCDSCDHFFEGNDIFKSRFVCRYCGLVDKGKCFTPLQNSYGSYNSFAKTKKI